MFEKIVLGAAQGIAEWLPVSSEGMIILIKSKFFSPDLHVEAAIRLALFLHLGTFLAALIYFRSDVARLAKAMFTFGRQPAETKNILLFLMTSTVISGILGLILINILGQVSEHFEQTGRAVTFLIGSLLLVTAYLELRAKTGGQRQAADLKPSDGIILGIAQGFAALPGLSRSGLTVSALLLRKMDKVQSLKLSFLMSLPIVLGGNVMLNWEFFSFNPENMAGLIFSLLFGLLTIHLLLRVAEKINFGSFLLAVGILTILSTLF